MSDPAFELEQQVRNELGTIRSSWVRLAALLHAFHTEKCWELCSCDTFNEWLGQPDIGLGQRHAYTLIQAWAELVVKHGVESSALAGLDLTKLDVILPALRKGTVTVEDALSDCESLSRSDLREKYRGPREKPEYHLCPDCGHRHGSASR